MPSLFATYHRGAFLSEDNEKSACSFAGTQFTRGELLMFLSAVLESSPLPLSTGVILEMSIILYNNNKGNSNLGSYAASLYFQVVLYTVPHALHQIPVKISYESPTSNR